MFGLVDVHWGYPILDFDPCQAQFLTGHVDCSTPARRGLRAFLVPRLEFAPSGEAWLEVLGEKFLRSEAVALVQT